MITDLLIIGGGLAARRCAQVVQDHARVTLAAAGAGASPHVHGICVPADPQDSVEKFINDTLKSGRGRNDPELVRVLCENSPAVLNEFPFDRDEDGKTILIRPLGASCPRVAGIHGQTGEYILEQLRQNRHYEELDQVRAMRLLWEDGCVRGAVCMDEKSGMWFEVRAKCTLLAAGGFGGIFPLSTNGPDIAGDAIAMADLAGAGMRDMGYIQYEPTVIVGPEKLRGYSVITTMLYEGAVIRNGQGNRFMDEKVNKDVLAAGITAEIRKGKTAPHGGVYYDMTAVPERRLKTFYRSTWEKFMTCGIDITREMVEIVPAPHTTLGGLTIDSGCRTSLPGLLACGESAGGVHGANRLGGNAGLEILVFGKIAGETALEELANAGEETDRPDSWKNSEWDSGSLRKRLNHALESGLSCIWDPQAAEAAIPEVQEIMERTARNEWCFEKMRLYNDARCAMLAMKDRVNGEKS